MSYEASRDELITCIDDLITENQRLRAELADRETEHSAVESAS